LRRPSENFFAKSFQVPPQHDFVELRQRLVERMISFSASTTVENTKPPKRSGLGQTKTAIASVSKRG